MRILIADDDGVSRLVLESLLTRWGHEVTATDDGTETWRILQGNDAPPLAILDWMMPGLDGIDICRRVRADEQLKAMYLILVTSHGSKEHILTGLRAGVNDYVIKPFDTDELRTRVNVGIRMVQLQLELEARRRELETARARLQQLQGLLPICAWCKRVRDEKDFWQQVEEYIGHHSDVQFSHGICPNCMARELKGPGARPCKPVE